MAFGKVNSNNGSFKLFTGVGSFRVLAINPDKKWLENFYGREIAEEPVYFSEVEIDGKTVKQARVGFAIELDSSKGYKDTEGNPINMKAVINFTLRNRPRLSKAGKYRVIDLFGDAQWVTEDEYKAQIIPANLRLTTPYKMAFDGEDQLNAFAKALLGIKEGTSYIDNKWVKNPEIKNYEDYYCNLEKMKELVIDHDASELQTVVELGQSNCVKILVGIRTTEEGRQYQTFYLNSFLRDFITDYKRLAKEVQDSMAAGSYNNVIFEVSDLHEFKVTPTEFTAPAAEALPDNGTPAAGEATPTPWNQGTFN